MLSPGAVSAPLISWVAGDFSSPTHPHLPPPLSLHCPLRSLWRFHLPRDVLPLQGFQCSLANRFSRPLPGNTLQGFSPILRPCAPPLPLPPRGNWRPISPADRRPPLSISLPMTPPSLALSVSVAAASKASLLPAPLPLGSSRLPLSVCVPGLYVHVHPASPTPPEVSEPLGIPVVLSPRPSSLAAALFSAFPLLPCYPPTPCPRIWCPCRWVLCLCDEQ